MEDSNRILNLVDKHIKEFTPNDTIYIKKVEKGFQKIYFCQFVSYTKGIVTGKIIDSDSKFSKLGKGEFVTGPAKNCCLWVREKIAI